MSDPEENDRKEALLRFTYDIGERIVQGYTNTDSLFSSPRIHKVPQYLRKLNESAYTPRLIAIGPLHRDDPHLSKTMQNVKMYYANHLFSRLTEGIEDEARRKQINTELLQQCVGKMEQLVERAKEFYAEEIKVKHDDVMAEMMLIDGCFILELLCCYHEIKIKDAGKSNTNVGDSGNSKALSSSAPQHVNEGEDGSSGVGGCIYSFCKRRNLNLLSQASSSSVPQPNNKGEDRSSGSGEQPKEPIFDNTLTANIVKHDLLLLENQIPFFVLKELFKLTVDKIPDDKIPGGTKLSLTEYVVSYFEDVMFPPGVKNGDCVLSISSSRNEIEQREKMSRKANEYFHILHLLHSRCLPVPGGQVEKKKHSEINLSDINLSDLRISASDLDYAGIKLEGKKRSLFNITFEGGNFQIPVIRVQGSTEAILRNLIAFEQCCPWVSQDYFTSYAMFMDMLINSEKDVQVLKNAKIIENYLGTDKYAFDLFNNLCKEIVTEDFYFSEVCQQAFNFTERNWWPMFIAYLKRTYFASPWGFIGFSLAFVAFGMSVVQFIYGFLK